MVTGKYLGVDYGDKRTGLAISDASGYLAGGIGYISEGGMRHTAVRVAREARERGAVGIVIGLPKNMDGSEGFRADAVKAFGALLGEETDLPLFFFDERLSTMQAHKLMDLTGTHGKKRKERVDTLSAQIILQDFLDRERNRS
jgi:putative Holliday junction resolvase